MFFPSKTGKCTDMFYFVFIWFQLLGSVLTICKYRYGARVAKDCGHDPFQI